MECIRVWRVLSEGNISQIIESTRNSLLNFILELADKYPQIKSDSGLAKQIPNEQIKQVFNYYILGGKQNIVNSSDITNQGDNMAIFDQREQNVETQYNAARDINFNDVKDSDSFILELEKLKEELKQISENDAIDAEVVTDTEYQLSKAVLQSKKDEPDEKAIVKHLTIAKQLIDGVKVATSLVNALNKAIEVVGSIFG